jgi:hypothetical protein
MNEVTHMKLSSGEEIVCEVLDWPDEGEKEIIVRMAFALRTQFDPETMSAIYGLVPWMTMVESVNDYIVLSSDHVVSITKATSSFLREYNDACYEAGKNLRARQAAEKAEQKRLEQNFIETLEKLQSEISVSDSDNRSNVLQFPPPDTSIH